VVRFAGHQPHQVQIHSVVKHSILCSAAMYIECQLASLWVVLPLTYLKDAQHDFGSPSSYFTFCVLIMQSVFQICSIYNTKWARRYTLWVVLPLAYHKDPQHDVGSPSFLFYILCINNMQSAFQIYGIYNTKWARRDTWCLLTLLPILHFVY